VIESLNLDRERSPMPSFRDIAADLTSRIAAGEWAPGEALPTTKAVAKEYGTSEFTAYRALSLLIERGVARGVRGGRRYVADEETS
jgi:DNA-binding GntR family transcriptional regulator